MIRIRSPTKEKLNSKSISDWKMKLSVAFFIEMKRRNKKYEAGNDEHKCQLGCRAYFLKF